MKEGGAPEGRVWQWLWPNVKNYASDFAMIFGTTALSGVVITPAQIIKARLQMQHQSQQPMGLMGVLKGYMQGGIPELRSTWNVMKWNTLRRSISDGLVAPPALYAYESMQAKVFPSSMHWAMCFPNIFASSVIASGMETTTTLLPEIKELEKVTGKPRATNWQAHLENARNVTLPIFSRNFVIWSGFFAAVALIDDMKQQGPVSKWQEIITGAGIGGGAGIASIPFDTIVTRQFRTPDARGMCYAMIDCAMKSGVRGLFAGATMRAFQMGVAIAFNMLGVGLSSHGDTPPGHAERVRMEEQKGKNSPER